MKDNYFYDSILFMPGTIAAAAMIVEEISFAVHWQEILELRHSCRYDKDPGLADKLFPAGMYDEFDDSAIHWGVFSEHRELLASARLSVHRNISELPDRFLFPDLWSIDLPSPIASLNRLSVATAHRGEGLSAKLDFARIQKALRIGCQCICGTAHGRRQRKLLNDGFQRHHSSELAKIAGKDASDGSALPLDFFYKLLAP